MGESAGAAVDIVASSSKSVPKSVPKHSQTRKIQIKNITTEKKSYATFEIIFVADQNYAWSIDVGKSPDEIRATLRTFKGLNRVHRQFYHLSVKEMERFILTIFPAEEHAAIRKLIAEVVAKCPVCKKHQSPAPKPAGQTKGLWSQRVNNLVCGDTFFVNQVAIMHFMCLFSGWSLFVAGDDLGPDPTPALTIEAFYQWLSIFGGPMECFFRDQGGEFEAHEVEEVMRGHSVRVLRSPGQSPFTNPIERHNGVAKIFIKKLLDMHPNSPLRNVLREAQCAKNITTRKYGFSAQFLAFAHPEVTARSLVAGLDDMYQPPEAISAQVQERLALRASAQALVTELATVKQLRVALTKGMQGTVTGPLKTGQKVDYWIIPSSLVKGHWLGPCTVIGPGGTGSQSSNKVWVIKRPNGQLTEAHRHRLRVINPVDHVQIPAEAEVGAPPAAPAAEPVAPEGPGPAEPAEPPQEDPAEQWPEESSPPPAPVRDVDDSTLLQWLLGQATSGGVTNDWTAPSQELRELVLTTFGEHFPPLLRVAYTPRPNRLRKPPRELRVEECGERLSLAWDVQLRLRFKHWDFIPTLTGVQLGVRIALGEKSYETVPLLHGFTLLFGPNTGAPPVFGTVPEDYWIETVSAWTRVHQVPRVALFTPKGTRNGPPRGVLSDRRITHVVFADGKKTSLEDVWTNKQTAHRGLHLPWTGSTVFPKRRQEDSDDEEPAQVSHAPVPGPGGSPSSEEPTVSGGSPPIAPVPVPAGVPPAEPIDSAAPDAPAAPALSPGVPPAAPASGAEEHYIGTPPGSPEQAPDSPEFVIGTPPDSPEPAAPPAQAPPPPRPVWDGPESVESVVKAADAIPGRATRSGLNFDHRGPRFDPSAHLAVGPPETYSLGAFFHAFFTGSVRQPGPEWLDSPTLLSNRQAHSLVSDHRMPIFDASKSSFFANPVDFVEIPILATSPIEVTPRNKEIPKTVAIKSPDFHRAMEKEMDEMIANGAKFGVPPSGIHVFSTRWVFTWKPPPDDCAKARLVVRGYEEKWLTDDTGESPVTDSPTLQRETLRLITFVSAQYSWLIESWDIKTAFQQTDTTYDPEDAAGVLWFKPPHPCPAKYGFQPGMAMCLPQGHTHYGLASAPRRFYFFLRGVMIEHKFTVGKYDECLFILVDDQGRLRGLCGFHVDDGLLTGDGYFWSVMAEVSKRIRFGKRQKQRFVFCGVRITQLPDYTIELDQEEAIVQIKLCEVSAARADGDSLTPSEVTDLRGRLGSILYITGNTRPFEAYVVSHLSAFTTEAKVTHLRQVNKVIKHLHSTKTFRLRYVKIAGPLFCYTFSDSNFKKERDNGSQTGSVTLIGSAIAADGLLVFNLLRWSSRRTRRVVHSTLAAETLAATFSLDVNEGTRGRLLELQIQCEGVLLTDCRSLFDHVYSMTGRTDEVLVPDFHQLREAALPFRHAHSDAYDGFPVELFWVPTHLQLADNLTKVHTPSTDVFFRALSTNRFTLVEYQRPRSAHQHLSGILAAFVSAFLSHCANGCPCHGM